MSRERLRFYFQLLQHFCIIMAIQRFIRFAIIIFTDNYLLELDATVSQLGIFIAFAMCMRCFRDADLQDEEIGKMRQRLSELESRKS